MDAEKFGAGLISMLGPFGLFILMFLESSFLPFPSEAAIFLAGSMGLDIINITIFGALGSTAGAYLGYKIGQKGSNAIFKSKKDNKWFRRIHKLFSKFDIWAVFIGRLIPIIPFKVFSISAGILEIKIPPFLFFTLLGSIPRCFILATFGNITITGLVKLLGL